MKNREEYLKYGHIGTYYGGRAFGGTSEPESVQACYMALMAAVFGRFRSHSQFAACLSSP